MTGYGYHDAREERDSFLVITTTLAAADSLLKGYVDWITEEIQDLLPKLAILEATAEGSTKELFRKAIEEMSYLRDTALKEARDNLRNKMRDVTAGVCDNFPDARKYIEDGYYKFDKILIAMLRLRQLVDNFSPPDGDGE